MPDISAWHVPKGRDPASVPSLGSQSFLDKAKLAVEKLVERVGFLGILACASVSVPGLLPFLSAPGSSAFHCFKRKTFEDA